jgi:hypothetical protein
LAALLVSYWFILYELLIPINPLFQLLYNFFYHGKNHSRATEKCKKFPGPSNIFFLFTEKLWRLDEVNVKQHGRVINNDFEEVSRRCFY